MAVVLNLLQLQLDELAENFPTSVVVIGGDFNARLGLLDTVDEAMLTNSALQPARLSRDGTQNSRGQQLHETMTQNGFLLLNGRSPGDLNGEFTFSSGTGNSVIDLIWINAAHVHLVENLSVNHIGTLSDHFPVTLELAINNFSNCQTLLHQRKSILSYKFEHTQKEKYCNYLDQVLANLNVNFDSRDVNFCYDFIVKNIKDCAQLCEMVKSFKTGQTPSDRKPWFDLECKKA